MIWTSLRSQIVTGAEVYFGADGMVDFPGFTNGVIGFT